MSGMINLPINGSNSNLSDNPGRALTNALPAQPGSSGPVLSQSGHIQGIHNINGSFNMPNMPGPYASRSVNQAIGNMSNGRYAINNLPNSLSQLSLGNTHGHSGFTNTGGAPALANIGNSGRTASSIGGLVGGANTSRGLGSATIANIHGLASRLKLSAPQVASLLDNAYSGGGAQVSQNQYQAGNNQFNFMGLLNDSNGRDSVSFDVSDFPQLSGQHPSYGGSQGQLGLMQKHNIGYSPQNQEFSIQNEDFPALPGYRGSLRTGVSADYGINTHQKEQVHANMLGRSSGFSFGGSYSSHHPQQQYQASSINVLVRGFDLTTLGLDLNALEPLIKKFSSPWTNEPAKGEPEFAVPECYYAEPTPPLKKSSYSKLDLETLFYIFYSMPKDEAQLFAANELYNRGWFYHRELRAWFIRAKNMELQVKASTHERGCYHYFDPNNWQTRRKDNFVLQYEMVEKRPALSPQQQ